MVITVSKYLLSKDPISPVTVLKYKIAKHTVIVPAKQRWYKGGSWPLSHLMEAMVEAMR